MLKEYGFDEVGRLLKKAGTLIYFCLRLAIPRRYKSSMYDSDTKEKIADIVVWMWFFKSFEAKLIPCKDYERVSNENGNV